MGNETEGTTDPLVGEAPSLEESLAEALGVGEHDAPVDNGGTTETQDTSFYTLSDGTQVPLEELEKGYLRQSDYTKKTQAAAQERAEAAQALALMEALIENPQATLEALQQNLLADTEENLLDPSEQKFREYDQRFQEIEQQEFERQLDGICSQLESQYQDFDRMAVLEYAAENNIPNLRAAYLDWREERQTAEQRAQHNAQALQAKRSAPPVAGRSSQLGGQVPEFREVNNINDAMANALLELQSNGSI